MKLTKRLDNFEHAIEAITMLSRSHRFIDRRDALLVSIGMLTTLRISDYIGLRWNDLIKGGEVVEAFSIIETKTKKHRQVVVGERLGKIIWQVYKNTKPQDWHYCFRNNRSGTKFQHISRQGANIVIKRACKKFGLGEGMSSHSLRKTGAFRIYEMNGANFTALAIVSKALNHSNTNTTLTYLGIDFDRVTESYRKL